MEIPLQLVILTIPSLIYVIVQRWRGQKWKEAFHRVGWKGCPPLYFAWSLGVFLVLAGVAWLAFRLVSPGVLQNPKISTSYYTGWTKSAGSFLRALLREAIYVALGEEIFFRGLLGGWLMRRLGFVIGNTMQSLLFLLPHLLLFTVSMALWPILLVQWLAGWLQGWLRYRSDSILPGWLVHSLANAFGALSAMK